MEELGVQRRCRQHRGEGGRGPPWWNLVTGTPRQKDKMGPEAEPETK